jgi:hypothetical protein
MNICIYGVFSALSCLYRGHDMSVISSVQRCFESLEETGLGVWVSVLGIIIILNIVKNLVTMFLKEQIYLKQEDKHYLD